MLGLPHDLGRTARQPLRLLCLGAHADDVEIGAGGTVLRFLAERPHTEITFTVLSGSPERACEARSAAAAIAPGAGVLTETFRDGFFPQQAEALKVYFRDRLAPLRPDLVLTHRLADAHQDHRAVARLSWETFRGARIAAYEVPKWDGDLDRPNAYVALDERTLDGKLEALRHFASQHAKPWFDAETFRGLARVRGVEAGVRYAEAFHVPKLVW